MASASTVNDGLSEARRDYRWVSVWFSIGHGCVTTPLVFATSALGDSIGSIGNSALYAATLFCGLCISVKATSVLGIQKALGFGMLLYVVYVVAFVGAVAAFNAGNQQAASILYVAGSVCGGLGAGLLWTSQGGYLARCAAMMALIQDGLRPQDASTELASSFGFWFLAFEVACKLGFAGLQELGLGITSAASLFAVLSAVSALFLGLTARVPSERDTNKSSESKFLATVSLWSNPRIWLISFTSVTFGFSAAYLNGYVTAHLATKVLGESSLGALSALTCATGAAFVKVFDLFTTSIGKVGIVAIGTASMALLALLSQLTPLTDMASIIVVLFVLQGAGRAVYEAVNRSLYADHFKGEDTEGAFANMFFQMSVSSIVGYALVPVHPVYVAIATIACGLIAPAALVLVQRLDEARSGELPYGSTSLKGS
eukprot:TRINITY_DN22454_c1_g2_i5.p1 TRINITY_DN22454_c1_g2~~TRINITY_DN22454_c1_g2_i5.p1  ORF type:complete len:429 (-),score=40.01 TRINITY_DN22454_c1_g2_i5:121-1407(-)